jgi:hypothetical protein
MVFHRQGFDDVLPRFLFQIPKQNLQHESTPNDKNAFTGTASFSPNHIISPPFPDSIPKAQKTAPAGARHRDSGPSTAG